MRERLGSARWVMLVVATFVAAGLMVLPASAYAKSSTRIVVTSKITVNQNTAGANPWPITMKTTLQKKISGSHYHGLSGTVTLYRLDANTGKYNKVGSGKKSSSSGAVSFSITRDGKYKLTYTGSSTTNGSTSYSAVWKTIGETLTRTDASIVAVPGSTTEYWVNATYVVGWNTEAWAGPVSVSFGPQHYDYDEPTDTYADGVSLYYSRSVKSPGTVEFNYKVSALELMGNIYSYTDLFIAGDDYIYAPAHVEIDETTAHLMLN